MKKLASLLLAGLFLITSADAGTISRPTKSFGGTSFVNGVIPLASDFNGDIDTVINEFNGSISNANISASAAIAGSKISPSFTTNPDVTSAAPCYKFIESDAAADGKRWDLCVNGGLWELRVVTDAGATTGTPISIVRSTGAMLYTGSWSFANKIVLYNNAAITDGQILIGKTSDSTFNAATLTGTASQVTVTNSAGGITVSLPNPINVATSGNATTATALAADPTDCGANTFAQTIAASGNLGCAGVSLSTADTTSILTPSKGGNGAAPTGDDYIPVADSTSAITWRLVPNCTDVSGNHINYTQATNTWSCGTTVSSSVVRSYLAGYTLSTAGSSATMSIAAGAAANSTNVAMLSLTAYTKTTGAWVLGTGNGCLDTDTIANTTWYHWWIIQRIDTSVVDVLCSLSATAPTMPTNYTLKRRIGAGKTDGAAQWVKFIQDGDYFVWDIAVLDVSTTNPGTSAVLSTLSVPTGVNVFANFNAFGNAGSTSNLSAVLFSDPNITDTAPSSTAAPGVNWSAETSTVFRGAGSYSIHTNTSAQIRYRFIVSAGNDNIQVATTGWIDRRGRDN